MKTAVPADAPIAGGNINIHLRRMRTSKYCMSRRSTICWVADVNVTPGVEYGMSRAPVYHRLKLLSLTSMLCEFFLP